MQEEFHHPTKESAIFSHSLRARLHSFTFSGSLAAAASPASKSWCLHLPERGDVQWVLKLLSAGGDHQSRDVGLDCKMRRCYKTQKAEAEPQTRATSGRVRQVKSINMPRRIRCIITKTESWKFPRLDRRRLGFVELLSVCQRAKRMAVESYVKCVCSPHSALCREPGENIFLGNLKKKKNPPSQSIFNKRKKQQHKNLLSFFLTSQSMLFSLTVL